MTAASRGSTVACGLALAAFATNSLLCRGALGGEKIDPASFTSIRVLSGMVMVAAFCAYRREPHARRRRPSWGSGFLLFLYAASFSYAYRTLEVGSGALILFAGVQATMIGGGLARGEAVRLRQAIGWAAALAGLVILLRPGWVAPDPRGVVCMAVAGVAWGGYSLRARGAEDPLGRTADNFLGAAPWAVLLLLAGGTGVRLSAPGAALAVASGALASGAGYVLWYAAIRQRTATSAAVLQLSVPVLAAVGAIVFLGESASLRLLGSSVLVLGGVALGLGTGVRQRWWRSSWRGCASETPWTSSIRNGPVTTSVRSSASCASESFPARARITSSSPIPTTGAGGSSPR